MRMTGCERENMHVIRCCLKTTSDGANNVRVVRVTVIGNLYSAPRVLWDEPMNLISKALTAQIWPVIARQSFSFTCHPLTNHNWPYSPSASGSHCAYPRRDGQAEFI